MFAYQQSYDKSISDELKQRFRDDVRTLEQEGFRYFSLHKETLWPFSVALFFPFYLMMAGNEYVQVESPLRISSYHLLYICEEQATLAYVYGLGCKFYTRFADGTWLVSNTSQNIRDAQVVTLKRGPEELPAGQVWDRHRAKMQELRAQGLLPAARLSFEDWTALESRFDRSNVASVVGLGLFWMALLAWIMTRLVNLGTDLIRTIF